VVALELKVAIQYFLLLHQQAEDTAARATTRLPQPLAAQVVLVAVAADAAVKQAVQEIKVVIRQ
jgi:hypothetical protein